MADGAVEQEAADFCLRRSIDVELRVLDEEQRTVQVIASTESLDSHGDIIKQFWDLARYDKNPVVLWNHNKFGVHQYSYEGSVDPKDLMPIGHSIEHGVKGKKLIATLKLGSAEYSAVSQMVFLGVKEKHIRAVSVGFMPGSITAITDKAGNFKHYELGSAERPNELREISFVPMGSNADAVAKSVESDRQFIKTLFEKQQGITSAPRATETDDMTEAEIKAAHAAEVKTAMDLASGAEKRATDAETREKALSDSLATEKARADKAEADLAAEKAAAKVLETDLAAAKSALDAIKSEAGTKMVKSYVGSKLAPAEEEEYLDLLKTLPAERVEKLIKGRPDLAVTKPATANGAPIKSSAPEPVSNTEDTGSALLKSAKDKADKAA